MKTRQAVVFAVVLASASGIAWGQSGQAGKPFPVPISPQHRIIGGKLYNPQKSPLWVDLATNVTQYCSSLKVTSIGKISIACDVFRELWDDGGTYGVYRVIGEEYVKTILIYNH